MLINGKSYINYLKNKDILNMRSKLEPFSSFEKIYDCDAIILVCQLLLKTITRNEIY